eukprot:jgi/Orpsp1_1/1184581/evm.model.c7180000090088.1
MAENNQSINNIIGDKEILENTSVNTGAIQENSNLNSKQLSLITTTNNDTNLIDNSITPTVKTANKNNINELPKSPLNNNNILPTSNSPDLTLSEATPTTQTSDKKRSFLFHKAGIKNKPRSFSLNFKSTSHSRKNSNVSPNLSFTSLNQPNNNNNNSLSSSIINNSSSLTSNTSSSASLNSLKKSLINQSAPSLSPENFINQPLRSESSIALRPNKSESHLNLLSPSPSQNSHHHHHHLFFHSLDRHHSRQSSNPSNISSNPSLNNSNYNPSLAIPPHHSSLSLSQLNQTSSSASSIDNNAMLRKASSRSTLNSTKVKNEVTASSPVPMGMSIDDYEIGAQI